MRPRVSQIELSAVVLYTLSTREAVQLNLGFRSSGSGSPGVRDFFVAPYILRISLVSYVFVVTLYRNARPAPSLSLVAETE